MHSARSKYNFSPTLTLRLLVASNQHQALGSYRVTEETVERNFTPETWLGLGARSPRRAAPGNAGPGSRDSTEGLSPRPTRPSRGSLRKWIPCTSTCASPPALTAQITLSGSPAPAKPTTPNPGSRSAGSSRRSSSRRNATAAPSTARAPSMAATTAGAASAEPSSQPAARPPRTQKNSATGRCASAAGDMSLSGLFLSHGAASHLGNNLPQRPAPGHDPASNQRPALINYPPPRREASSHWLPHARRGVATPRRQPNHQAREGARAEVGSSVEAAVQCGSGRVQRPGGPGIPQLNKKGGLGGRFRVGRTDTSPALPVLQIWGTE